MLIGTAFLRHVLPHEGEGFYAATRFQDNRVTNHFFDAIEDLADFIDATDRREGTVYHACGAFAERGRRNKENSIGARALWGDLDLKRSNGQILYSSKAVAADALLSFCKTFSLPVPALVDSGYGFQFYWPFTATLTPDEWLRYAHALRATCEAAGFWPDHARTCDLASILRTPGTHNRKDPADPKPVRGGTLNGPYEIERFAALLRVQAPRRQPSGRLSETSVAAAGANIYSDRSADAGRIARNCTQIAGFFIARGNQPEPEWYGCLGVIAYCEDSDRVAHKVSSGDSRYTFNDTQKRLDRLRSTLTGATTCARFELLNPEGCQGCPHKGKINSPIALGYERNCPEHSGEQKLNGSVVLPPLPKTTVGLMVLSPYNPTALPVLLKFVFRNILYTCWPFSGVSSGTTPLWYSISTRRQKGTRT